MEGGRNETAASSPSDNADGEITQHTTIIEMAIPQEEVAMRTGPRCSECDSEDPKIICLRNPEREHYCGRFCLREGQAKFMRWIRRTNAEAAS
jgi:hypothetical protein